MGKKKDETKKKKRQRMGILSTVALVFAPITYLIAGLPGTSIQGIASTGTFKTRITRGFRALTLAYFGFDVGDGKFKPSFLMYGWLPVAGVFIARKMNINRLVPRTAPLLLV